MEDELLPKLQKLIENKNRNYIPAESIKQIINIIEGRIEERSIYLRGRSSEKIFRSGYIRACEDCILLLKMTTGMNIFI